MKLWITVLLISVLVAAGCACLLFQWVIIDGTRFDHTMIELRSPDLKKPSDFKLTDPWGNPYLSVNPDPITASDQVYFSSGPDGKSSSLGNDPDDIAPWTKRDAWLRNQYPVRETTSLLLLALVALAGSAAKLSRS